MIILRKSTDRGRAEHGWLDSWHSFSFADYHDPAHVNFSVLRVINEDRVAAGQGFATHGHRDMEILSYVLSGSLQHRDSMGNGKVMTWGEVQLMSAGTGVMHSEFNPSVTEGVHFLQIWIVPNQQGVTPGYQQKHFSAEEKRGRWCLLISPDGNSGSLKVHQAANVYAALVNGDETLSFAIPPGRNVYLHLARGAVRCGEYALAAGDALMFSGEHALQLEQGKEAELLLFDLP